MPRRKAAQHCKILPWLSWRSDCEEGRFCQVGNSLLLSHEIDGVEKNPFVELPDGAKVLYLSMCMEAAGKRTFEFPLSAAKKYCIPNGSLRRNIKKLIDAGFIRCQSGYHARLSNVYEFSLDWKHNKQR